MPTCLIGLGSNLGDRALMLETAVQKIAAHGEISLSAKSRVFRSAPIGGPAGQSQFFNTAIKIETALFPSDLLALMQRIELDLGRNKQQRWDARPIDLDILLYDDLLTGHPLAMQTDRLELPHPRMAFRRFVLAPAVEIAAEMVHPRTGWTIQRLWDHLIDAEPYLAISGISGSGKTRLARLVAEKTGFRLIRDPAISQPGQPSFSHSKDASQKIYSHQIDLMQRRAALLQPSAMQIETISDFWFAQSVVSARLCLTDRFYQQFQQQYNELARQVRPPKLLLFLDDQPHRAAQPSAPNREPVKGFSSEDSAGSAEYRLSSMLREQVPQGGLGPSILLDASKPQWALTEACAAIEAMRCPVIALNS